MKVYVLSLGHYDPYPFAVFSSQEKLDAYVAAHPDEWNGPLGADYEVDEAAGEQK